MPPSLNGSAAGEPPFQNPRNAAAGTLRNLDPSLVSKRGLRAFTYQLVAPALPATHGDTLTALRTWGLPVEAHWRVCQGVDDVVAFCAEWAEKRRSLDFARGCGSLQQPICRQGDLLKLCVAWPREVGGGLQHAGRIVAEIARRVRAQERLDEESSAREQHERERDF